MCQKELSIKEDGHLEARLVHELRYLNLLNRQPVV